MAGVPGEHEGRGTGYGVPLLLEPIPASAASQVAHSVVLLRCVAVVGRGIEGFPVAGQRGHTIRGPVIVDVLKGAPKVAERVSYLFYGPPPAATL